VDVIAVSPDGTRLAAGDKAGTVQIWELQSAKLVTAWVSPKEQIRQLKFSPDGKRLAVSTDSGGAEGIVEMRDVATGQVQGKALLHRDFVADLEFSRDGRWLATAGEDHSSRVWDAATGEPISPWLPHGFEARQVIFSPDGRRLVTRERRGAVRMWSAVSGEPITAPIEYARNTGDGMVSYSPVGQLLLISRGGSEAWLRVLRPTESSLEELRLLAEVLSCTRCDPAAGLTPLDEAAVSDAWKKLRPLRRRNN